MTRAWNGSSSVQGAVPFRHGIAATSEADVNETVIAGVHALLHGYLA